MIFSNNFVHPPNYIAHFQASGNNKGFLKHIKTLCIMLRYTLNPCQEYYPQNPLIVISLPHSTQSIECRC